MLKESDLCFTIEEFIIESNKIENVHSKFAIVDSIIAWNYIKNKEFLKLDDILNLHRNIIFRLNPDIAGKLRKIDNKIEEALNDWILKANLNDIENNLHLSILKSHIEYEYIHPFEDGNGRTGRLLYVWQCLKNGIHPMLFRQKDKFGYYSLFAKGKLI